MIALRHDSQGARGDWEDDETSLRHCRKGRIRVSPFFLHCWPRWPPGMSLSCSLFAEGSRQNHLPSRLSTIHYLKPVSLFGFQKVCTSFVAPTLVIPAQANL